MEDVRVAKLWNTKSPGRRPYNPSGPVRLHVRRFYHQRWSTWLLGLRPIRDLWLKGRTLVLAPPALLENRLLNVADSQAAVDGLKRKISHDLYLKRQEFVRTATAYILGVSSMILFLLIGVTFAILGLDEPFLLCMGLVLATEFTMLLIAGIYRRGEKQANNNLLLVNNLLQAIYLAEQIVRQPQQIELRDVLARQCRATAESLLAACAEDKHPKIRAPKETHRGRLRVSKTFKKRRRYQIKQAASKLESYSASLLEPDNYWIERTRDDFARVLLRVTCGSWLQINQSDIGVPGDTGKVTVRFYRNPTFLAVLTAAIAVLGTVVATIAVIQWFFT